MPRKAQTDHYETLGVSPDAEPAEIKRAYRALALKHHPDKSSEASATDNFAAINCAWDVIGDAERRREYDMQREVDGERLSRRRGPLATVRTILLGSAQARSFRWSSGMPYLRRHSLGALHEHLRRGRTALLFLHLGGSPRAARSAPAMLEARRQLRGAVRVAAVDLEAEPELARSLMPGGGMELPAAVLITARAGARHFAAPLNASTLVDEAVETLRALPSVCTAAQLRGLLATAEGAPRLSLALVMPRASKALRTAARVASAATASLQCARVPHTRCALPSELLACHGVALLGTKPPSAAPPGTSSLLRHCLTDGLTGDAARHRTEQRHAEDDPLRALRAHAASRSGRSGMALWHTAASAVAEVPALRAAAAVGDALRGAPLGRALDTALAAAAAELMRMQAPLAMLAAGLVVWSVRAIALGGPLPRAGHRGSGGRRIGRSRGRRRAPSRTRGRSVPPSGSTSAPT